MSESKNQGTLLDEWINAIEPRDFQEHVRGRHKLHQLHFIARLGWHRLSQTRQNKLAALNEVPPAYRLPWIKDILQNSPTPSKIDYVKANIVDAVTTGNWEDFLTKLDST